MCPAVPTQEPAPEPLEVGAAVGPRRAVRLPPWHPGRLPPAHKHDGLGRARGQAGVGAVGGKAALWRVRCRGRRCCGGRGRGRAAERLRQRSLCRRGGGGGGGGWAGPAAGGRDVLDCAAADLGGGVQGLGGSRVRHL
jgi:hypothetical protein